jgi:hypothetical protein
VVFAGVTAMLTTTAYGIGRKWNTWVVLEAGYPVLDEVTGGTIPYRGFRRLPCPPEGCARWYNVFRGADFAWYSNAYK